MSEEPSCPPRLPFVFSVGITGHRKEALAGANLASIEQNLRDVLELLSRRAAAVLDANRDVFLDTPPKLLFVSPLADGADQWAAELALQLGFELHALLPFDVDTYRRDLGDEDARQRLDALLSRASCILELPGDSSRQLEAYVMAGRATVAHSDVLIAVWDGLPPRGRGGTGEVVRLAIERATPAIHIPVAANDPMTIRWSAFVPAVETHFDDPATVRPLEEDRLDAVLKVLLAPPADAQERGFVAEFHAECRRRLRARLEYPLLLAATGVSRLRPQHWRADLCAADARAEWERYGQACMRAEAVAAPLTTLQVWYEWADSLAGHFAQSYRSGHVFNFVLGALAVVLALTELLVPEAAKTGLAFAEFVAVFAILLNTWLGNRRQWHRRWLDYRQLAERLRPMRSLKLLGVAGPDPPGTNANPVSRRWVEWYAAAVWRAIGCPTGRIEKSKVSALASTIADHELAPQIDYHRSTARQVERLDRRLEKIGFGMFAGTLIGCVVLLTGLWLTPELVHRGGYWFTMVSAGLPAIGTAVFGIRVQGDYVGSAARSEQTAIALEGIAECLREQPKSLSRSADLVEQAARTMLTDLDEWRLLNQQHELSIG